MNTYSSHSPNKIKSAVSNRPCIHRNRPYGLRMDYMNDNKDEQCSAMQYATKKKII